MGNIWLELMKVELAHRLAQQPAGQCFVAGTVVQTADGEKRIEDVKEGDIVISANPERGAAAGEQPRARRVTRTFGRTASAVVDIRVGVETITATPEHPFWVVGAGWTHAGQLRRGSALLTKDGVVVYVDSVERREGAFKVYNFEVEESHTYYVSSLGVLVHNQCQVDLTDSQGRGHILDGHATGGGHRFGTGIPGKSEFPASWSDGDILHNISDVAADPASTRTPGWGGLTVIEGTGNGVDIRVIIGSPAEGGRIITGFPTNTPRNP
jgi:hypothetical protein